MAAPVIVNALAFTTKVVVLDVLDGEPDALTVMPEVVAAGVVVALVIVRVTVIGAVLPEGKGTGLVEKEGVAPAGSKVPVRESVVLPAPLTPVGVIVTVYVALDEVP